MADPRTAILTDESTNEDALPDVAPGEEHTICITPQLFIVLHYVLIRERGLVLVRLRIGDVEDVPFELISASDTATAKIYHLKDISTRREALRRTGAAAVANNNMVAIPPGMHVYLVLRNTGDLPAKPRAGLFVQEEEYP